MSGNELKRERILSSIKNEDFVGRNTEIDRILRHAKKETQSTTMAILSVPNVGLSELFRQIYDQLFYEQGEIVPVYFSFSTGDETPEKTARRFLQTFLVQVVAFRRADVNLLDCSPDVCELSERALPGDGAWIDRLVAACDIKSALKDERSFVKQALSAPLRAKAHGVNVFVMFDSLENINRQHGEFSLLEELKEIYYRSSVQFVLGGRRRFVLNALQGGDAKLKDIDVIRLNELSAADARLLTEKLSEQKQVKINDQTRDLIVRQFDCNPHLITSMFHSAQDYGKNFLSFNEVEQTYTDSLLGGRICKTYDTIFNQIAPNPALQKRIIKLLADEQEKIPLENWIKELKLSEQTFYLLFHSLNFYEIIGFNTGLIDFSKDNEILREYIKTRYELEVVGESRAFVVGKMLTTALKRAPEIMARFYRQSSAFGLREILRGFNCQNVPSVLFDYENFRKNYKGENEQEIQTKLKGENQFLTLPQIVFTTYSQSYYPPISQLTNENRSAIGIGFEKGSYTDDNQIVWITAEIESKLEVSCELTEFWCDRLEMIALMCNFINFKIWLVSPEGFSPEACEFLKDCRAFGSSRKQFDLLSKLLNVNGLVKQQLALNEYEMVVPMGDDTEMISANAIEEIARRHDFQPRAINQIKTALVEACINAAEHSHSPDRKIYQKFTIESDKIIITVANRGVKIPKKNESNSEIPINTNEGRRGWGLKLMQNLMDEVKFEQVDDGTKITMVKYLK